MRPCGVHRGQRSATVFVMMVVMVMEAARRRMMVVKVRRWRSLPVSLLVAPMVFLMWRRMDVKMNF